MRKLFLGITLLASVTANVSLAMPPHRVLHYMDKDRDGKISKSEFFQGHSRHFLRMDENENGVIEADEIMSRLGEKMVKHADSNKDGSISKSEFNAHIENRFDKIDANKDGFVTQKEGRKFGRSKRFEKIDANGDGSISREEFMRFRHKPHKWRHMGCTDKSAQKRHPPRGA